VERDILSAAFLRGEFQLSQTKIGALLGGLSQSRVSRLLKLAEARRLLDVRYRFLGADELSPEHLADLQALVEPKELLDILRRFDSKNGVRVREVRVVDTGGPGETPRTTDLRLARLGRGAATRVGELLQRSSIFAVTWGQTVSHVVDALAAAPPRLDRPVTFVPVCAEPLDRSSNKETSSHLVQRLHRLLQPDAPPPPSLTGVPALIPLKFLIRDHSIRQFIEEAASYREIFGGADPLIKRVDTLITSVGPADRPMGFIHDELLKAGSIEGKPLTATKLASLVAGDIGGILIPRRTLKDEKDKTAVEALNEMWTGVKRKHLERIARDADRNNRPGVIVVSLDRPEIVAEVIRQGLVNELIIDRATTGKVAQLLEEGT
jgi:DNA-binding transcriptional regulator LsrR (DeoR family)